jgi:hypothetical protein
MWKKVVRKFAESFLWASRLFIVNYFSPSLHSSQKPPHHRSSCSHFFIQSNKQQTQRQLMQEKQYIPSIFSRISSNGGKESNEGIP